MRKTSLLLRDEADFGSVVIDTFQNLSNFKTQYYVWSPKSLENLNGIIIALHGITSHAKFDFLNHRKNENGDGPQREHPRHLSYTGSWPETFNDNGYIFCGYDQQGHGSSQGWSRCNIELFDHLAYDALHLAIIMDEKFNKNRKEKLKIFILGISMGGGVVLRTLQLYRFILRSQFVPSVFSDAPFSMISDTLKNKHKSARKDLITVSACQKLPLVGGVSLCPGLSLEAVKKRAFNRLILPLSRPASFLFPHALLGTIAPNVKYPWIEADRRADSSPTGVHIKNLPARIGHQNLILGPRVMADIKYLSDPSKSTNVNTSDCQETANTQVSSNAASYSNHSSDFTLEHEIHGEDPLSLVIIHSKKDTMTDCQGSIDLREKLSGLMSDIDLWLLDDMWHYLTLEPGNEIIRARLLTWMNQRCCKSIKKEITGENKIENDSDIKAPSTETTLFISKADFPSTTAKLLATVCWSSFKNM